MSLILKLWQAVPTTLQLSIVRTVQRNSRVYRWLMFRHIDAKERANSVRQHLPPAELRYRVGSSPHAEEFVAVGKACADVIQSALLKVGDDLGSHGRILDFGCGCGRTLIHLKDLAPSAQIDGTDIDAKAIQWCKQYLPFATFKLNSEMPPLDYPANTFDLIYAISVFTHLSEEHESRWLEELQRIARPEGILVVTVNGLTGDKGFVFERSYETGLFPDWYQNTYHSEQYVFANFSKFFAVLGYFPRSLNASQDVVVLQKRRLSQ